MYTIKLIYKWQRSKEEQIRVYLKRWHEPSSFNHVLFEMWDSTYKRPRFDRVLFSVRGAEYEQVIEALQKTRKYVNS